MVGSRHGSDQCVSGRALDNMKTSLGLLRVSHIASQLREKLLYRQKEILSESWCKSRICYRDSLWKIRCADRGPEEQLGSLAAWQGFLASDLFPFFVPTASVASQSVMIHDGICSCQATAHTSIFLQSRGQIQIPDCPGLPQSWSDQFKERDDVRTELNSYPG